MTSSAILIFALALAAAPAETDRLRPVLRDVAKMERGQQQAWLGRLEQRSNRAALLTLPPDEATRQQAKTRSQLHQKTITLQVLLDVIEETDAREHEAIGQLADRYGSQQAWRDVYAAWKEAGEQFEQQDRLLDWLEKALRSATSNGPIPEEPSFEGENSLAEQLGTEVPSPRRAAPPLPPPEPAAEVSASTRLDAQGPLRRHDGDKRLSAGGAVSVSAPAVRVARVAEPPPRVTTAERAVLPHHETAPTALPPSVVEVRREITVAQPAPTLPADDAAMTDVAAHEQVVVHQEELAARIGGYNLAIRALETDLDEKEDWTAERLEPMVDRLKVLATRRRDLDLFREAVPAVERSSLRQLASAKSVVSQLAAGIFEARSRATGANFKGTEDDRQVELRRLEDLSRRLAEMADK